MTYIPPSASAARAALSALVGADALEDDAIERRLAVATWSLLVEPGDGVAGRLIAALGAQSALVEVAGGGRDGIARDAAGLTPKEWSDALARWRPRLNQRAVFDTLAVATASAVSLITPDDIAWPRSLDDLGEHAPLCLWVRGDPALLSRIGPSVAIVGARAATSYGEHIALELSAELAGRGVCIISGAAYGIDGAAHRAALATGGATIALLAGGAERAYPTGHTDLIERIAASGAVVSEVPCGSQPSKWRFLQRNRNIAALATATVVVEAGWRSGSLNTAGHAVSMSRPLGAVPGPVTSAASAGCHRLLREFDARCVTNADEVMELLGDSATLFEMPRDDGGHGRTDDVTRVRDALSSRAWRETDDVARRAGMAQDDVASILALMALEGSAVRTEAGWRRLSRA